MRNVGTRIRTLRIEKGITLPELAERAKLSKGLLSKLENEPKSNPSLDTLFKIAEGLNASLTDIIDTEKAQLRRIVPEKQPEWQKGLVSYLRSMGKEPDEDILNALHVLRNRKAARWDDVEQWKFLYQSIENSFKK